MKRIAAAKKAGTVQEVIDYCKKLIDGLAKDGGFILSPRSSTDEVKPENFKAMTTSPKNMAGIRSPTDTINSRV